MPRKETTGYNFFARQILSEQYTFDKAFRQTAMNKISTEIMPKMC